MVPKKQPKVANRKRKRMRAQKKKPTKSGTANPRAAGGGGSRRAIASSSLAARRFIRNAEKEQLELENLVPELCQQAQMHDTEKLQQHMIGNDGQAAIQDASLGSELENLVPELCQQAQMHVTERLQQHMIGNDGQAAIQDASLGSEQSISNPCPGSSSSVDCTVDPESMPKMAEDFLKRCFHIEKEKNNPSIHKLQLKIEKLVNTGSCEKHTFGTVKKKKKTNNDKVIMVLGATGSGKTTLINGMINYILGVTWEDKFRFKLIDEQTNRSQAESQTTSVIAYQLPYQEGFQVPYGLTIIDTPGFGDTRGIDQDRLLIEEIRRFFSIPNGIDHIDAVCFVAQSSLARLTYTQKYIFDSILSIFGNDIADNILILVTFADGQKPPLLEAITASQIPCSKDKTGSPVHFKFNNSALFAHNVVDNPLNSEEEEDENFEEMFWKMGTKNLKKFFIALNKLQTKSLWLTKEVLEERRLLEALVEGLQPQIKAGLSKQEEIRQITAVLEQNKDKVKANKDFEYEVPKTVAKQELVTNFITNCQKCHFTCHYPCGIPDDNQKFNCWAMDNQKNCRICPAHCVWSVHFNQKYRWIYEIIVVKGTYKELKENYEKAYGEVLTATQVFLQLKLELSGVELKVLELINELSVCVQRLEEIALRPNPLSTPDYIDLLIESEKEEAKPGYMARIQSLLAVREKAIIISSVANKKPKLNSGEAQMKEVTEVKEKTRYFIWNQVTSWIALS
ncbi:uncharacterized protein LOC115087740 [Rhinatrema bivittatum]|uniref:uncharacterized protein LOC115087740 n=1 Tax=Rhinatrema bivittatum TaxID=194408 RepID=UPI0011289A0F|nr:uncharacterized protein LOC115087740 [Rhinatrema bivittatum]XP_029451138.1 uncharacterized protein LOC115087740 [Rhinatrema bivittatum]XP_029451146.1 uncharacterized protein LOC115087740 [Rhinatrema bivittatum]